jgi:methyltransferase-like protein/cyclopropane fatty-acyl-phospholipid synthase-like methyltransferase
MTSNIELLSSVNTYDELPYESYPYAQSHPYYLMTLGTLFGMKPPAVETAKVLELGCAGGGNLIPHAVNYPKAHFVGIDLSKVQIDEANQHVNSLGLKNIEFHNCSITDIEEKFGKFDYIICHGVISWVPEFVRDKIFAIVENNLTENGIAYISYNTLPGWNMIRTIRDMMLYHSLMFNNIQEKVSQARLLLDFIKDSLEGSNSPYAEVLKAEAALLSTKSDHYLRHDHLEEDNKQYYFHEFIDQARKHNLQYLSDCNISTMYLGNMPPKVVEKLQSINDIVRTEQYMDFITNRRFRATLLCHNSVRLNRAINNEDIKKFNVTFNLVPEKSITEIDINNSLESIKFFYNGNKDSSLSTSSPIMKALLYSFAENINNPLSFDKLCTLANKKLKSNMIAEVKNEFLNNAMKLVLQGYIQITLQKTREEVKFDKPKVSKMVSHQVCNTNNMWVTNLKHEVIGINLFEKVAFRYMDGTNDKDKIIDSIVQHISNGELTISKDGVKLEDPQEIKNEINSFYDSMVHKAVSSNLLV